MNILLWYSFNEVLKGNEKLIKFFVSLFLYFLNEFQISLLKLSLFLYFLNEFQISLLKLSSIFFSGV